MGESKKKVVSTGDWKRHVIDASKPWRSVFVFSADLDGDDFKDLITGGWWYKNPGNFQKEWVRKSLGEGANNAALIADFDRDGDPDVLASTWHAPREWTLYERLLRKLGLRKYHEQGSFVWALNDGFGRFEVLNNIAQGHGDFLQGTALIDEEGKKSVVLSWHKPDNGLQVLSVPDDPVGKKWPLNDFAEVSQDEEISVADIDADGDPDLVLGTKWLRNEGEGNWSALTLHQTNDKPDRNRAVDLDGNGKIDVIVGYEAISVPGKLAWYEQDSNPTAAWKEHLIATVTGPMSLDVADLDGDDDLDIVVGEHNLAQPNLARLLWYENLNGDARTWETHLVHVGDEHHDGAQLVDLDNDGDKDIVSIGWGHDRLILYENLAGNPD